MSNKKCRNGHGVGPARDAFLENILNELGASFADGVGVNTADCVMLPTKAEVDALIQDLCELMSPGYAEARRYTETTLHYALGHVLSRVYDTLTRLTARSFEHRCTTEFKDCTGCSGAERAEKIVRDFLAILPSLRESYKADIIAAYDGDPAALNYDEVLVSYPGLRAVLIQRLAHGLHVRKVPFLPRMMTEYIHSLTGIDIHPGAQLGRGIFIDHGTGVVIGETCIIGDGVKIYQGVTLGALSFPKDESGNLIRGKKRHPTIEDRVTLYAGATVLGDIVVGHDSIIGGNVWLTEAVPPHSRVTTQPSTQHVSTRPPKK